MYLDSHAHLTCDEVFTSIDDVLKRATLAGVTRIINICTDTITLERGLQLKSQYPNTIFNAGATTPHDVDQWGEAHFKNFETAAFDNKLIAIGETGLDYHYSHSDPETQKQFLRRYLHLAQETKLPIIIHCREAFPDLCAILDQEYRGSGVLHCFTGTLTEAKELIKRGFFISLSGIITFKKAEELRKVASWVPLDQLLIETDTPYLAPQPFRGKMNEPGYVIEIAKLIANLKNLSIEDLAKATTNNARRLFKL